MSEPRREKPTRCSTTSREVIECLRPRHVGRAGNAAAPASQTKNCGAEISGCSSTGRREPRGCNPCGNCRDRRRPSYREGGSGQMRLLARIRPCATGARSATWLRRSPLPKGKPFFRQDRNPHGWTGRRRYDCWDHSLLKIRVSAPIQPLRTLAEPLRSVARILVMGERNRIVHRLCQTAGRGDRPRQHSTLLVAAATATRWRTVMSRGCAGHGGPA